jgi:hypothetical protein
MLVAVVDLDAQVELDDQIELDDLRARKVEQLRRSFQVRRGAIGRRLIAVSNEGNTSRGATRTRVSYPEVENGRMIPGS